jgi:hypothetical protein
MLSDVERLNIIKLKDLEENGGNFD